MHTLLLRIAGTINGFYFTNRKFRETFIMVRLNLATATAPYAVVLTSRYISLAASKAVSAYIQPTSADCRSRIVGLETGSLSRCLRSRAAYFYAHFPDQCSASGLNVNASLERDLFEITPSNNFVFQMRIFIYCLFAL